MLGLQVQTDLSCVFSYWNKDCIQIIILFWKCTVAITSYDPRAFLTTAKVITGNEHKRHKSLLIISSTSSSSIPSISSPDANHLIV
jgi:hypothetical protein